jgi:hypothetical protein
MLKKPAAGQQAPWYQHACIIAATYEKDTAQQSAMADNVEMSVACHFPSVLYRLCDTRLSFRIQLMFLQTSGPTGILYAPVTTKPQLASDNSIAEGLTAALQERARSVTGAWQPMLLKLCHYKREVWLECVMECPSTQAINTAQYIDDLTAQQLHDVLGVLAQVVKIELTVLPTERYRNVYCKMTRPNSLLFS